MIVLSSTHVYSIVTLLSRPLNEINYFFIIRYKYNIRNVSYSWNGKYVMWLANIKNKKNIVKYY